MTRSIEQHCGFGMFFLLFNRQNTTLTKGITLPIAIQNKEKTLAGVLKPHKAGTYNRKVEIY